MKKTMVLLLSAALAAPAVIQPGFAQDDKKAEEKKHRPTRAEKREERREAARERREKQNEAREKRREARRDKHEKAEKD